MTVIRGVVESANSIRCGIVGGHQNSVLQVVSATKTNTFSTVSTTPVNITGLSASITPKTTASKVLVRATLCVSNSAATAGSFIYLRRGNTNILLGDTAGFRTASSGFFRASQTLMQHTVSMEFMDSPSTTSTTTYNVALSSQVGGYTATVGKSGGDQDIAHQARTPATITLMEIGV